MEPHPSSVVDDVRKTLQLRHKRRFMTFENLFTLHGLAMMLSLQFYISRQITHHLCSFRPCPAFLFLMNLFFRSFGLHICGLRLIRGSNRRVIHLQINDFQSDPFLCPPFFCKLSQVTWTQSAISVTTTSGHFGKLRPSPSSQNGVKMATIVNVDRCNFLNRTWFNTFNEI